MRLSFYKPWRFATFFIGLLPLFAVWDELEVWVPNDLLQLMVVMVYVVLLRLLAEWVGRATITRVDSE